MQDFAAKAPTRYRRTPAAWLAGLVALVACGPQEPAGGQNLLLITVDTLRADYLEPYGAPAPISPAIRGLAEGGVVFEDAWSSASWTLPALASLHTGLHSSAHGCWEFNSRLDPAAQTLAESLVGAGWDTGAVVNHVFLGRKYGLAQGFVDFDDELVEDFGESHAAITSPEVTAKGLAYLEAKAAAGDGRPWFLWLHFFDPHEEYKAHPEYTAIFGDTTDQERYRGEIAFTDHSIGRVLAALDRLGLSKDTLVAFVADHGEEWQDHGGQGHGHTLYGELVHVPLILRVPGLDPRRVQQRVSIVDVRPTLLELLGLPTETAGIGRSLVPLLAGREIESRQMLAEVARSAAKRISTLGDGSWKLIWYESEGRSELYDLEQDPREQVDLAAVEPQRVASLLDSLKALRARTATFAPHGSLRGGLALGDAEQQSLEALGYVQGK